MRLRVLGALVVACLGTLMLLPTQGAVAAVAAAPHAYPATTCATLSVSTENPRPGESITVSGSAFTPNTTVTLVLNKTVPTSSSTKPTGKSYALGTFTADSSGAFSATITLPDDITNKGHYYIYATSGAGTDGTTCPVDPHQELVFAAADTSSSTPGTTNPVNNGGSTANTGFDIAAALVVAALLLGSGYYLNRRGRKSHSHS